MMYKMELSETNILRTDLSTYGDSHYFRSFQLHWHAPYHNETFWDGERQSRITNQSETALGTTSRTDVPEMSSCHESAGILVMRTEIFDIKDNMLDQAYNIAICPFNKMQRVLGDVLISRRGLTAVALKSIYKWVNLSSSHWRHSDSHLPLIYYSQTCQK